MRYAPSTSLFLFCDNLVFVGVESPIRAWMGTQTCFTPACMHVPLHPWLIQVDFAALLTSKREKCTFGNEFMWRGYPPSHIDGCPLVSFLQFLWVSLWSGLRLTSYTMASRVAVLATSLINDEVRKFIGNHDHLHLFGNNSPKVSDIQWKKERQMDWPLRKPITLR